MTNEQLNTPWRQVAAAMYKKPTDSKIFGSVELDITELEQFIQRKRKDGLKITFTHVLLLTIARAIREEAPEFNTFVRRGSVVQRDSIDASLSVLINGDTEMGSVLVTHADQMNLQQLVAFLSEEVIKSKQGEERKTMRIKRILSWVPWPFRGWLLSFVKRISVDWGVSIPALGVSANSFGSFVLSNIGSIGLDMGYPALMPAANVSVVFIMGGVNTKPAVVNGEIIPRRIMNLGAALDHRVVDAIHAGRMFRYIKKIIQKPELLEEQLQ